MKQKVLIAADDWKAVSSASSHLEKDGYQVFMARSCPEALRLIHDRRPDILVMDQEWLKKRTQCLGHGSRVDGPVIVLMDRAEDPPGVADVGSGLIDYIAKPVDASDVLSRVRSALLRWGKTSRREREELRCGDVVVDRRSHQVSVRGEIVELTPTEFEFLEILAMEPGRAFTRLELLWRVFGHDYEGLERTVDTHVKNLRKKIEEDPTDPTYIQTIYGIGYKFTGG